MCKLKSRSITDTWQISQDFDGYEILTFIDRIEYRYWDQLHREDGPAVIFKCGSKQWFLNGLLHRENGPAIEYANGTKMWYLNGFERAAPKPVAFTDDEKKWLIEKGIMKIKDVEWDNSNS